MRVPLSWIRDFVPVTASTPDLVAALNQLGLEVEAVDEPGAEIEGVRVARIVDVVPHPNADRLQLADVEFGGGTTRVVCGATNIAPGMLVPFAPVGARLPGGFVLERRKIRGVTSEGMLCSAAELALGDDHAGILGLEATAEVGADVRDVLDLHDVIFDLAITPNRPDAMCIVGVARELAAHFGLPLEAPEPQVAPGAPDREISIEVEAPDACPRYLGWVAQVQMGESPAWMRQRLVKAGMRPISNVVDVTNYVLLERNQPLHAFDLAGLASPGIVVRHATADERITTLDRVERVLEPTDLLICDADRVPQALAGIMGGSTAEVSPTTAEILLEAAYFERMGIARSSKRLKLRSESSARFERGIDPNGVRAAATRAMELLGEVAGAAVAGEGTDVYPEPILPRPIRVRTAKVNAVLGTALSDAEVLDALVPLGIEVQSKGDDLTATAPTFRPDLEREVDIVEEVARRVGFDSIGRSVARPRDQVGLLTPAQRTRRAVADALMGAGLSECQTISLVAPESLARFGQASFVEVANPLRHEESVLRTLLVPGLLEVARTNVTRGRANVALFEIGTVFSPAEADGLLPTERAHVAGVLAGGVRRQPVEPDRPVDAYDVTDLAHIVAGALGIEGLELVPAALAGYRSGQAALVHAGDAVLGVVGEVDTEARGDVLSGAVVAFEIDLDEAERVPRRDAQFVAPSPFPPSTIDLAFVVSDDVSAAALVRTIREAGGGLVEEAYPFDEFRGGSLGEGLRSVAVTVRFRAPDRTLTDDEVAGLRAQMIGAVAREHNGRLRE